MHQGSLERSSDIKPQNLDMKDVFRPNLYSQPPNATAEPLYLDQKQRDIAVPAPLNGYLKGYQRIGVQFFYDKYAAGRGAVLGDDMG